MGIEEVGIDKWELTKWELTKWDALKGLNMPLGACSPNPETVEFTVSLFPSGNEERRCGPIYHIHLGRQKRGYLMERMACCG